MMYPLVTDSADEGIPIAVTCRVLGFSKQGYFKWRAKPVCDRDLSDAYLINAAFDAHGDDPGFHYRFISDELEAAGYVPQRTGCSDCAPCSASGRSIPRNGA